MFGLGIFKAIAGFFGGWQSTLVVGVLLMVVAGGAYGYHLHVVNGLKDTIIAQNDKISEATKKLNEAQNSITKLTESNSSLERHNKDLQVQFDGAMKQVAAERAASKFAQDRANAAEALIRSQKDRERSEAIAKAGRTELLLNLQNANNNCEIQNYGNIEGKCIRGRFVKEGQRVVPSNDEALPEAVGK